MLHFIPYIYIAAADAGKKGGMLQPIIDIMIQILDTINSATHSYGWAVVIFAVLIKLLLYYPTQQQYKSMKDMQKIQPLIKDLQKKYKDKPQELQQKQVELFREHGVNPVGGCLPLIIQMPILIGIWQTIMQHSDRFANERFLWIGSEFARSLRVPWWLADKASPLSHVVAANMAKPDLLLLLFYGFSMYLSQKFTVSDPSSAKTQQIMNLTMPIAFTWFMWAGKFPSAVILYWLIFNILSILQQAYILREPDKPLTKAALPVPSGKITNLGDPAQTSSGDGAEILQTDEKGQRLISGRKRGARKKKGGKKK